jgi:hypothetical protein
MPNKKDNVQVTGGGGAFKNEYASGSNVGGRVGITKQLDEDSSITAGFSGYKNRIKFGTPEGDKTFKKSELTGVDLTYRKDDSSYGVNVRKEGKDNKVMLNYNKSFAKGGMVAKALKKTKMATGGMTSKQTAKVGKVMGEFKDKGLHSGKGGKVVTNPKQAIAIALSEAKVKQKKK